MPHIVTEETFPCGYKVEFRAGGFLRMPSYSQATEGECPIHGEDCPPEEVDTDG